MCLPPYRSHSFPSFDLRLVGRCWVAVDTTGGLYTHTAGPALLSDTRDVAVVSAAASPASTRLAEMPRSEPEGKGGITPNGAKKGGWGRGKVGGAKLRKQRRSAETESWKPGVWDRLNPLTRCCRQRAVNTQPLTSEFGRGPRSPNPSRASPHISKHMTGTFYEL